MLMTWWIGNANGDVTTSALGAFEGSKEPGMIAGNDEVGTEYGNDAFERNVCGVSAHRLWTYLLTIGCDGVAVF